MALISEALEDPGVGYARLRNASDESGVWEINLLPLQSDFGAIDRVIGCLHPLSGIPPRDGMPLRFRIEHMSIETIGVSASASDRPGLAEPAAPFRPAESSPATEAPRLTAIDGDGSGRGRPRRGSPHLRLVKK